MKRMIIRALAFFCLCLKSAFAVSQDILIYNNGKYSIYENKVVQGLYSAIATEAYTIRSNYQSPPNRYKSAFISFKFAINGEDNEMLSGIDHYFIMPSGVDYAETPLIKFGRQITPHPDEKPGFIQPGAILKIRLDMRHVLKEFEEKGYYENFKGDKIYKRDFKGVYVAGGTSPLTWDFSNLKNYPHLKLQDDDGDGIFEIELDINSYGKGETEYKERKILKDLSAFPQLISGIPLMNAMYHLSLEEMENAVEPDSTFRTGKEWAGVWTRDISYSIILSLAHLHPEVSKISLKKKVNRKGEIVQDTGTGGAWPVSTDRTIWGIAAWEIFKVTGDKAWLKESFEILKRSLETDRKNVLDEKTGLLKGESSFLDWREQTYPYWMEPVDIFESINLGTNAVHYQAYRVLSEMATELREFKTAQQYQKLSASIKEAINRHLWMEEKGYYAQYLYGRRHKIISPRAEALGNALAVIFGIADHYKAQRISENLPVTDYGVPCIFPQIPDIPPYHNNGIWPFVQAYWMLASSKAGNAQGVMESIAAIYRPSALFLTNQENFVAENGDYAGTQINSANMLWSLSGNLSIIYKVIFGIDFQTDRINFKPFIPQQLQGNYQLKNLRYRNAVLNITIEGFGDEIKEFYINEKASDLHFISAEAKEEVNIRIVMNGQFKNNLSINKQPVLFSLPAPQPEINNNTLQWESIGEAVTYLILKNGRVIGETDSTEHPVTNMEEYTEYQVVAIDKSGISSFASPPVIIQNHAARFEAEEAFGEYEHSSDGYSGMGYVETTINKHPELTLDVKVPKKGNYLLRVRYANGSGSVKTDNKCAVRKLVVNKKSSGVIVLPQRGQEEWSNWGWSNMHEVKLKKGRNKIQLIYTPDHDNMNLEINKAYIDCIELIPVK